jgi:hypothetical protein
VRASHPTGGLMCRSATIRLQAPLNPVHYLIPQGLQGVRSESLAALRARGDLCGSSVAD